MKLAIFSLALLSPLASAAQCTIDSQYMQASYKVSQQHEVDTAVHTQQFTLWRTPTQAAQQDEQLVEVWQQLSNQQLRPIRYFVQAKRGIEYQPSEVKAKQNFSSKQQLVSDELLAKMTLQSEHGEGCDKVQKYQLKQPHSTIELTWAVNKKLLESMQVTNSKSSQTITLQSVSFNKQTVQQQFAVWDNYQTTDYADIGDNENDPFLAKMINLGFIEHSATGFYDTNGKALEGGHNHSHH
ncbi:hypothetical protein [Pseudoalteromonas sp. ZZD1]|uniref:hypothetical protein n=1 Tax=Pseudoalteromonas sp. ZZD1 TaxID=3139395 RepID=UPI003BA9D4E8